MVLCSALAEVFLLKMRAKRIINYYEGDEDFQMKGEPHRRNVFNNYAAASSSGEDDLIEAPEKSKEQLLKIRDLLFRYGSTGCHEVIKKVLAARAALCLRLWFIGIS